MENKSIDTNLKDLYNSYNTDYKKLNDSLNALANENLNDVFLKIDNLDEKNLNRLIFNMNSLSDAHKLHNDEIIAYIFLLIGWFLCTLILFLTKLSFFEILLASITSTIPFTFIKIITVGLLSENTKRFKTEKLKSYILNQKGN